MKHGDRAWLALTAAILGYEIAAPRGELLSEAVDRYRQRHPILVHTVVFYLAAHLTRLVPSHLDPLHRMAVRR
jgi:hypothetical protein